MVMSLLEAYPPIEGIVSCMAPSAYDVLILGERIFCDLIFAGLPQLPKLGEELHCRKLTMTAGGPANTAIALRRLGLRPGLIADVGNDFFSQFVLDTLGREDVDTALVRRHTFPAAAVTAAFPLDDDRAMATYLPNAAEARTITRCNDVHQAGEMLHSYGPTVVIKLGCRGAIGLDGRGWTAYPALAIEPLDTTGAGDCFAAGFILGLRLGLSLVECLRYGNIAGGLSTLGCGATSAPTYAQFVACLAQTPLAGGGLSQ
jgi:sugar/nucleoside kinase (ribokinase family)